MTSSIDLCLCFHNFKTELKHLGVTIEGFILEGIILSTVSCAMELTSKLNILFKNLEFTTQSLCDVEPASADELYAALSTAHSSFLSLLAKITAHISSINTVNIYISYIPS